MAQLYQISEGSSLSKPNTTRQMKKSRFIFNSSKTGSQEISRMQVSYFFEKGENNWTIIAKLGRIKTEEGKKERKKQRKERKKERKKDSKKERKKERKNERKEERQNERRKERNKERKEEGKKERKKERQKKQ